jgi:tetratricopeptide (TPR) repeat protein
MILEICGLISWSLYHQLFQAQAEIHLLKSEYTQARNIYTQIIETNSLDQDVSARAFSLLNMAHIDAMCGDMGEVFQKLNQAKDIFSIYTFPGGINWCRMILADIKLKEGKFDLANVKFQEYLHSIWGTDNQQESFCLERLADITAWPTPEMQTKWPVIYCGHVFKSKDKLALHKALLFLGDVFIADDDGETALNIYTVALEGFTYMDVHCSRAHCMIRLGDLANKQGHVSKAISFWMTARPLFEQSLQAKDVAQIDARLSNVDTAHQKALLQLNTPSSPQLVTEERNI